MLYGLLDLSFWGYVIATLVLTQTTIASVTIFLHRHQAHRALDLHPIASHFFRCWLWLTTGMVTREWVAIHRKHHAHTEYEGDPHSPRVFGFKKVLWEGAELYRVESKKTDTVAQYSYGTPNDWLENHLYAKYPWLGVTLLAVMYLVLFGIPGVTLWAIQMFWIPFFAAGVINGVGHHWGYRNFESPDASRNIVPLAFFVGGEELHNNHHTYASSAKFSVKWWEFDIGWMYIRILSFFRLARVKKELPKLVKNTEKSAIDAETFRAVFINRFQILADYYQQVMKPVFNQGKKLADQGKENLFRDARALLKRENLLISAAAKTRLSELLKRDKNLEMVYQYRLKLQAIWARSSASQNELIEALQQWCRQAEATGIESLSKFAQSLSYYVPHRASR